MKIILITLVLIINQPPVITACREIGYKITSGEFQNLILAANKNCRLSNMKYHYYRVTNGLEPLSPKWESLEDLENKIKELERDG